MQEENFNPLGGSPKTNVGIEHLKKNSAISYKPKEPLEQALVLKSGYKSEEEGLFFPDFHKRSHALFVALLLGMLHANKIKDIEYGV